MSILRSKHSGWTHEGRRTPYFGGGGGGGPASTTSTGTTYQTNIPEYAQPYVETMLGATQKQLFNMDGNEITGFRPYQPYSTNVSDYVAPMSPLQQQAIQATGQLEVPGQFAPATDFTLGAGLGSLGAAQQAMGAGQQYAQMATSPAAQQAYMSPYMQNVVDYQKGQALRDYNIGQQLRKAQGVGQGAFGGNRAALMEAEAQRNLTSQLQGIEAQGRQTAFQQAQQAQQFGSQLGMQGLQTGLQGYGQMGQAGAGLGSLGAQQLAAQKDVAATKYSMGAQQQAMEQQKINQAIQDWANTQQYPLMQLGVMSNMLRGLPMQSATTNQYVAAPNALTQGIGTVGALGSLGRVFQGGKEGGLPSEFKPTTGIKSYNIGGSIKGKLYDMSPAELQDYIKETSSPMARELAEEVLRDKTGKASGGIIAFKNPNEENNQGVVKAEEGKRLLSDYEKDRAQADEKAKADIDAENQRLLGRSPAPSMPTPAAAPAPSGVRVGRAGIPIAPNDSPRMRAARAAESAKGFMPSADELAIFAEQERNLAASRAASPLPGRTETTTIPGTSTVTNVPQGTKTAPPAAAPAPAAAAPAPAPSAKAAAPTGITAVSDSGKPVMEKVPTLEEILKQQETYLGPNKEAQEYRSKLMAERADSKAEASRQNWMRMAEFFASWGSNPGSVINAGLTALKNKIPDFISDAKEQTKIIKDIDKSIYELNKADRLEKAGNFKEAAVIRDRAATIAERKYGHELSYAASLASSRATVTAAQIKQKGDADVNRRLYFNAMKSDQETLRRTEADAKKTTEHSMYIADRQYVNNPKNKDEKDYASRKQRMENYENEYEAKTRPLKSQIDFYRRELGIASDSGGSPQAAPKAESVTIKDKTYTRPPNMTDQQWMQYKKDVGAA